MTLNTNTIKQRIEKVVQASLSSSLASLAIETIKQGYKGKIWVAGGFISDLAVKELYNHDLKLKDIDLMLAESINLNNILTPAGWERRTTHLKGLRFRKKDQEIDIWCLPNEREHCLQGLDATLDNYFKTVPLTIQALAYDLELNEVKGEQGIKALQTKTVEINNIYTLVRSASFRGQSAQEYLRIKAEKIGFTPTLFSYS